MILTYRYRIYPTKAQARQLDAMLFGAFVLYNDSLRARRDEYSASGESLNYNEIAKYWTRVARQHPEHPVARLPNDTRSRILEWQKIAYNEFFKEVKRTPPGVKPEKSPPHFRKLRDTRTIPFRGRNRERLRDYHLPGGTPRIYLQGVGEIKTVFHRFLPENALIKWVNVTKEHEDKWYASLQIEFEYREQPEGMTDGAVGIDIGLHYVIATSDRETVPMPGYMRERQRELRRLQRKADRQRRANNPQNFDEKGSIKRGVKLVWHDSSRYKETMRRVKRLHGEVARQRDYFWDVIVDDLTRRYHILCIEDLTLDFMKKNKRLAGPVADAAPGMFWLKLSHKAAERGCRVVKVDPRYTSQTCSECGHVDSDNRKSQAVFRCVACGHSDNADVNAAKNILKRGLSQMGDRTDVA